MTKLGQGLIKGLSEAVEAEGKSMSHIIGKVYEVSRESIDKLAAELEAVKAERGAMEMSYTFQKSFADAYQAQLDRLTQANGILRKGLEKYIAICEKLVDKSEKDKLILKPSGADELATVARDALAEADKLESENV